MVREMIFRNRIDAGKQLAEQLMHLRGSEPVVLALPRGGVPVAAQVAKALGAPLDVIIVRKLGAPGREEFALGAIAEGVRIVHEGSVRSLGVTEQQLAAVEASERTELDRRVTRYRGDLPPVDIRGRTVVIVDDGVATGATAKAAAEVVRAADAERIVVAVPVAPADWVERCGIDADEFVAVATPARFMAIGQWYTDFTQTTDEEVAAALA